MLLPGETVAKNQLVSYMKGVDPYKSTLYTKISDTKGYTPSQPFFIDAYTSYVIHTPSSGSYFYCTPIQLSSDELWYEGEYSNISSYTVSGGLYAYKTEDKTFVVMIPTYASNYGRIMLYKFTLDSALKFSSPTSATFASVNAYSAYPVNNMCCLSRFEGTDVLVGSAGIESTRYLRCINATNLGLYTQLSTSAESGKSFRACCFVPMDGTNMVFVQGLSDGTQEISILTRDSSNNLTLSANKHIISYADLGTNVYPTSVRGVKLNGSTVLLVSEIHVGGTLYIYAVYINVNVSGKYTNMTSKQLLYSHTVYWSNPVTNNATLAFTKKEANKFTLLYTSDDYYQSGDMKPYNLYTDFVALEVTPTALLRHQKIASGPVNHMSRPIGYLALQTGNCDRRGVFELDYDMLLKNLIYSSSSISNQKDGSVSSPGNSVVTTQNTKSGIAGITKSEGSGTIQLITQGTSEIEI